MLLSTAVKARLPLISVELDDPLNASLILSEIIGSKVEKFPVKADGQGRTAYDLSMVKAGRVYLIRHPSDKVDFEKWYAAMAKAQAVTILANPERQHPAFFSAGVVTCPPSLVRKFVKQHHGELDEEGEALVAALAGLNYKAIVDLSLMAQAQSGELSARSIRELRRSLYGSIRGLQQVSTDTGFYLPNAELETWLELDGQLFLHAKHKEMQPRGLLFGGPPGTGKTMGAKYIAATLDLPLYVLDIGGAMDKYIGESEAGLRRALAQVDECGPCVMLVDEVEKLFKSSHDSGVTSRLLSILLWWLQEHRSRVLTVMTTNDNKAIPAELVRPGRIDALMKFNTLGDKDGWGFMQAQAKQAKHIATVPGKALADLHKTLYAGAPAYSQATLTGAVMGLIKTQYLTTLNH